MPMKTGVNEIVVDGYNLIHKLYDSLTSATLEVLRMKTEEQLLFFQKKSGCLLTIVYDGKGSARESAWGAPLHIVFTPASKSADLWIIDYVKSLNTRAKMVTIVSSDDEIRRYATAFGARCEKSETFALQLKEFGTAVSTQNNKKLNEEPLSDREVARWMKLFCKEKS